MNVFRVLVCHEEYCSAGVAEIMEADLGQVRSLQEGPEVAAERGLVALVVEVKDVRSRDQVRIRSKAPLVRLERAAGAGVGQAGQPLS